MEAAMTNISRRSLFAAGVLGAGAIALGSLAGCGGAPKTAAPSGSDKEQSTNVDIDSSQVVEVVDSDVLVVGAGLAGLAAAARAAENGASVVLLESQPTVGGNGKGVEGSFFINTSVQKELNLTQTCADIIAPELTSARWVPNALFLKDMCETSPELFDWLLSKGVKFAPVDPDEPLMVNTLLYEGGAANASYVVPMQQDAIAAGVDLRVNTRGMAFALDSQGKVKGVYARDRFDDLIEFDAGAVILATGGYANNDKLVEEDGYDLETLEVIGAPGHYGDTMEMVLGAGGHKLRGRTALSYNRIGHVSSAFGANWQLFCCGGPFLWVNQQSERFVNENAFGANLYLPPIPVHNQPGCIAYSVFDQQIFDSIIDGNQELIDMWGTDLRGEWEQIIADGDDAWRADTLDEVAQQAGLDAAELKKAVDTYNAACVAGVDDVFGKDAEALVAIENGPFYIAKMHEAIEGPLGGVVVDRQYRPVINDGEILEHVYAVGTESNMLYAEVYPADFGAGSASGWAIRSGWKGADYAVEHAKENTDREVTEQPSVSQEQQDKNDAKKAVMAIASAFNRVNLGLTAADSPVTIDESDSKYADFFKEVLGDKSVEGLDVSDIVIEASITEFVAETFGAGAEQTTYTYNLNKVTMKLNGKNVEYGSSSGLKIS